jgi:ribonuclease HI
MTDRSIVVFTDGAAKGNPGPGGWDSVAHTTNNRMELTGAISALAALSGVTGAVAVYTDSTYVIKGIQEWIWAWRKRGWKTAAGGDVMNRELWEQLADLVTARGKGGVEWHYVRGHVGIPGNERVDEIADGLAQGLALDLYQGALANYPIPILDVPSSTSVPRRTDRSTAATATKAKSSYSYLSLVDGQPMRHSTWADCERRVKGRSGARYKKAMSQADEASILREWRIDPSAI